MTRVHRFGYRAVGAVLAIALGACGDNKVVRHDDGDTVAPVTTASPAAGTYVAPLDVTLTANEPATIYYTTNGSTPSSFSPSGPSPLTVTLTSSATLTFFSVDASDNQESPKSEVYTVDGTAPTSSVDIAGRHFNTTFDVTLTADEPGLIYYTTDGTAADTTSPSAAGPVVVTITAGADVTLSFFAVDALGNAETTIHSETYVYDSTGPTVLGFSPADSSIDVGTYANVAIHFSEAMDRGAVQSALALHDGTSNVGLTYRWYRDASGTDWLYAWPSTSVDTPFADAAQHTLTLGVAATDLAGNALQAPLTFDFTTADNSPPVVIALNPDPGALADASDPILSVTFDRDMDTASGTADVYVTASDTPDARLTLADAELSWVGARTLQVDATGNYPPPQGYCLVVFSDLHKANGDLVRDVVLPVLVDQIGSGDTTPPVLDTPSATPTTLDPRAPLLAFSEIIDPATLGAISVEPTAGGAAIDVAPQMTLWGRGVRLSTAAMTPGVSYTLTIEAAGTCAAGTALCDAAGNTIASTTTIDFEVTDPAIFATPHLFSLAGTITDVTLERPALGLEMPGGVDFESIGAGDLRAYMTLTGEPIRGLRLVAPDPYRLETFLSIEIPAGVPALQPDTAHTIVAQGLTSTGINVFAAGTSVTSLRTVADDGGTPGNSRPLFVPGSTVGLQRVQSDQVQIEAAVEILDDDATPTVELWFDGSLLRTLVEDATDPGHYLVSDSGPSLAASTFAIGWNELEVVADDGTHQVVWTTRVYLLPDSDVPTISDDDLPHGAVIDASATASIPVSWSAASGQSDRQILMLAEQTFGGGEPSILGIAVLDRDVTSFDLGERWHSHLVAGHTYLWIVDRHVTLDGLNVAGHAGVLGRNIRFFTIRDETLGSISGEITTLNPIATAPTVLIFDQIPGPSVNVVGIAIASPGSGPAGTSWVYVVPNLVDDNSPGYYVWARADVLGNDVDGDASTEDDNLDTLHESLANPVAVPVIGGADVTGVNLQIDNYLGRILVDVSSTVTITGNFDLVVCDDTATSPPFDSACTTTARREPMNSQSASLGAYNLANGTYRVWGVFDIDGDGQSEMTYPVEAADSPVTVAANTTQTTITIDPPTGVVSGTVDYAGTLAGNQAIWVILTQGGPPVGLTAATYESGTTYGYELPYLQDGSYSLSALLVEDGHTVLAWGTPNGVTLDVTSGVAAPATVDFAIGSGRIEGTVTLTGTLQAGEQIAVLVYAQGGSTPLAMAMATWSAGADYIYDVSYLANGDYDVQAVIFNAGMSPVAFGTPNPDAVTVTAGSTETSNFAVTRP